MRLNQYIVLVLLVFATGCKCAKNKVGTNENFDGSIPNSDNNLNIELVTSSNADGTYYEDQVIEITATSSHRRDDGDLSKHPAWLHVTGGQDPALLGEQL